MADLIAYAPNGDSINRVDLPGVPSITLTTNLDAGAPTAVVYSLVGGAEIGRSDTGASAPCDLSAVRGAVTLRAAWTRGSTTGVLDKPCSVHTPTQAESDAYAPAAIGREVKVYLVPRAEYDQRAAAKTWPADGNLYLPEPGDA